jgi:tRNA (cytidine/uridine-2'-O-)-methyltransferase
MKPADVARGQGPAPEESRQFLAGIVQVVLYCPEIPQNTGNVARTCAATRTPLHLIEPLGFFLTDRYLKRAGLDYWSHVNVTVHPNLQSLQDRLHESRFVYFSTRGEQLCFDFPFRPGDCLVFGSESRGLPRHLLEANREQAVRLPIDRQWVRSLNLATTVGVALFEAMRQLAYQDEAGNRPCVLPA